MMYPDVYFLGGKLLTVRREWVKPRRLTLFPLRYHHEGDSQPLSVDLKGGHQALTNSTGVITKLDSSPKNSYPPRSLQHPRVTRSMGKSSTLAQITICFGRKMGKGQIYHRVKDPSRTLSKISGILDLV